MSKLVRVSDKTFKVLKRLKMSYAINTFNDAITALIISQGLNQKVIK